MTLLPVEPTRITIDESYEWCTEIVLPPWCQVPWCGSGWHTQKHHIVRRSHTGGPLDYITVDGVAVQNVFRLCQNCHSHLTSPVGGHRAMIRWFDSHGWVWCLPINQILTPEQQVCCSALAAPLLYTTPRGQTWRGVGLLI